MPAFDFLDHVRMTRRRARGRREQRPRRQPRAQALARLVPTPAPPELEYLGIGKIALHRLRSSRNVTRVAPRAPKPQASPSASQ
jgi:hypothetical protein